MNNDMKSKYDWSSVPKWVKFLAKLKNGKCYGFDHEPFIGVNGWTMEYLGHCEKVKVKVRFKGDWEDSLESRPNKFY